MRGKYIPGRSTGQVDNRKVVTYKVTTLPEAEEA